MCSNIATDPFGMLFLGDTGHDRDGVRQGRPASVASVRGAPLRKGAACFWRHSATVSNSATATFCAIMDVLVSFHVAKNWSILCPGHRVCCPSCQTQIQSMQQLWCPFRTSGHFKSFRNVRIQDPLTRSDLHFPMTPAGCMALGAAVVPVKSLLAEQII